MKSAELRVLLPLLGVGSIEEYDEDSARTARQGRYVRWADQLAVDVRELLLQLGRNLRVAAQFVMKTSSAGTRR